MYLYDVRAKTAMQSPVDPTPLVDFTSLPNTTNLGWVVTYGHLNGDALPDLVFGSNGSATNQAYVYYNTGTAPYFPTDPDATLTKTDFFGYAVGTGDFNGDGRQDLAVGTLGNTVYVYH